MENNQPRCLVDGKERKSCLNGQPLIRMERRTARAEQSVALKGRREQEDRDRRKEVAMNGGQRMRPTESEAVGVRVEPEERLDKTEDGVGVSVV